MGNSSGPLIEKTSPCPFEHPRSARRVRSFGHRVPKASTLPCQHHFGRAPLKRALVQLRQSAGTKPGHSPSPSPLHCVVWAYRSEPSPVWGGRFELRADEESVEPKNHSSPQTSERNATKSRSRCNPKTTRKNPT